MSVTPYYEDEAVTLYHGDCREILPQLEAVDHVITDPPYDARTHAGARTAAKETTFNASGQRAMTAINVIQIDFAPLDVAEAVPMLLGVTRRWVVCFCTMEMIAAYQSSAGEHWVRAGFWRRPDGAPQFTGDRPATPGDAVAIMHGTAERKRWNGGGHHAYWEHMVVKHHRVHPTQKPESLMCEVVSQFSDPGDVILDPFGGSGTTAVAAKRLGRRCILIEREEKYCETAATRLNQGALDLFGSSPTVDAVAGDVA